MALDMLVDATQLDSALTSVADAIRAKGGTSAQLAFPAGFVSAVQAIPTGGGGGGDLGGDYFSVHVVEVTVGSTSISTTLQLRNLVYGLAGLTDLTNIYNDCFYIAEAPATLTNNFIMGTSVATGATVTSRGSVWRYRNGAWNTATVAAGYDAAAPAAGTKYIVSWIKKETGVV